MAAILQKTFQMHLNENLWILDKISLKYSKGPIDNRPALVQIMAAQATSHYTNQL